MSSRPCIAKVIRVATVSFFPRVDPERSSSRVNWTLDITGAGQEDRPFKPGTVSDLNVLHPGFEVSARSVSPGAPREYRGRTLPTLLNVR